jgi:geranylgeranyl diphosphate synthase type I
VEGVLERFFADESIAFAGEHPAFLPLFDELERVALSGGKRLRPVFCCLGYRAGGGEDDDAIARIGAALELFHTFALIHDDVMDEGRTRRGEPTIQVRMAERRGGGDADADRFGVSSAILAGDLSMVLADHLFLTSGFPVDLLHAAFRRYNRMRVEVAVGQFLDIAGSGAQLDAEEARTIAGLKSGGYTVTGPLLVGALLGVASQDVFGALSGYGTPLGEAFQIRNDIEAAIGGGPDLGQGRPTVLLAKARELAGPTDLTTLAELIGRGPLGAEDQARVAAIMERSGALAATKAVLDDLVEHAIDAIEGDVLPGEVSNALRWLARSISMS